MSGLYDQPEHVFKERMCITFHILRLCASADPAYLGSVEAVMLRSADRETNGWLLAREVGFPVLAFAVIVASADIRIPMGLPGHRGLVWLTLLVTVALVTRTRETVVAVGAASTMATLILDVAHGAGGLAGSARYLAAAVMLYAVAATPIARRRRWLIAFAAAPIHLVALAGSVAALISGGYMLALVSVGMTEKVLFHLGFGLAAGLLAWVLAFGMDWFTSAGRGRVTCD